VAELKSSNWFVMSGLSLNQEVKKNELARKITGFGQVGE
jgi:hypothetical protein